MEYCPTDQMVSNFFMKPLQGKKFMTFCDQILNASSSDDLLLDDRFHEEFGEMIQ